MRRQPMPGNHGSARVTGRSFWRTSIRASPSRNQILASRKTGCLQRQLGQARLFPDRRGNELLLHTASSKDPASETMQATAPRCKSGAKPTGCRRAATTTNDGSPMQRLTAIRRDANRCPGQGSARLAGRSRRGAATMISETTRSLWLRRGSRPAASTGSGSPLPGSPGQRTSSSYCLLEESCNEYDAGCCTRMQE